MWLLNGAAAPSYHEIARFRSQRLSECAESLFFQLVEKLLEKLLGKVTEPFVHGRGHRKSELQRDIELLQGLLKKRKKYTGYQETFQGRNSFSKTDPDAVSL